MKASRRLARVAAEAPFAQADRRRLSPGSRRVRTTRASCRCRPDADTAHHLAALWRVPQCGVLFGGLPEETLPKPPNHLSSRGHPVWDTAALVVAARTARRLRCRGGGRDELWVSAARGAVQGSARVRGGGTQWVQHRAAMPDNGTGRSTRSRPDGDSHVRRPRRAQAVLETKWAEPRRERA